MSAPTGLFMNWVNVTVTPEGGSAIAIDAVTAVSVMRGSRQEIFYGDARLYARLIKNVEKKRSITITSGNVTKLLSIPEDIPCTISATLEDPKNNLTAGGGAITVVMINSYLEKQPIEGQNNKYASNTVTFNACGAIDGVGSETEPLTTTAV